MAKSFSSNRFLEYAYSIFQSLPTKVVNVFYVGDVTPAVTRNFTIATEESLLRQDESGPVQRKVFNVMVEALQNISRHADLITSDPDEMRRGVVIPITTMPIASASAVRIRGYYTTAVPNCNKKPRLWECAVVTSLKIPVFGKKALRTVQNPFIMFSVKFKR